MTVLEIGELEKLRPFAYVETPELAANPPELMDKGETLVVTDQVPKDYVEAWCVRVAAASGADVGWFYSGGRIVILSSDKSGRALLAAGQLFGELRALREASIASAREGRPFTDGSPKAEADAAPKREMVEEHWSVREEGDGFFASSITYRTRKAAIETLRKWRKWARRGATVRLVRVRRYRVVAS